MDQQPRQAALLFCWPIIDPFIDDLAPGQILGPETTTYHNRHVKMEELPIDLWHYWRHFNWRLNLDLCACTLSTARCGVVKPWEETSKFWCDIWWQWGFSIGWIGFTTLLLPCASRFRIVFSAAISACEKAGEWQMALALLGECSWPLTESGGKGWILPRYSKYL